MSESMERAKQDFDDLVGKWEAALEKGIFGDSRPPATPSKSTAEFSFFGPRNDKHTDSIDSSDSEYWRAINAVADGGVEMQRLDEDEAYSKSLPNPIRRSSEGMDQAMEPHSLGVTFSEKDIEELDGMKKKLHELESKAAAMDGSDQSSQIAAMIKRIGDLSDKLGRTYR